MVYSSCLLSIFAPSLSRRHSESAFVLRFNLKFISPLIIIALNCASICTGLQSSCVRMRGMLHAIRPRIASHTCPHTRIVIYERPAGSINRYSCAHARTLPRVRTGGFMRRGGKMESYMYT